MYLATYTNKGVNYRLLVSLQCFSHSLTTAQFSSSFKKASSSFGSANPISCLNQLRNMPFAASILGFLLFCNFVLSQTDYSQYVNPFIGAEGPIPGYAFGGGDIFVGGAVPFGSAKVGIDTYEDNITIATLNGGYTPKGKVTAVSMMHESGTGGFPKYGIISQMPLASIQAPVNVLDNQTYWQSRVGDDIARVGYFRTKLENDITIELSGTRHAGIMQYSFEGSSKHVLVDVSHYLPSETGGYSNQYYAGGEINILPNGSYTGNGDLVCQQ
jgi:hypothetical protein